MPNPSTNSLILPNFLVVGAARCGTTYLYSVLKQHPSIYIAEARDSHPATKDTHFFDHRVARGEPLDLEIYSQNFVGANQFPVIGEVSTSYMFFDWIPKLLFEKLGADLKIVFILRDPVKRAYSDYFRCLILGNEYLSFEDAISRETERSQKDYLSQFQYSYVLRGMYMEQIRRYRAIFRPENLYVVISEKFYQNPLAEIHKLSTFLGIEKYDKFDLAHDHNDMPVPSFLQLYRYVKRIKYWSKNKRSLWRLSRLSKWLLKRLEQNDNVSYPAMLPETERVLIEKFKTDTKALVDYLGYPLPWKSYTDS